MKNRNIMTVVAVVATLCVVALAGTAWWLLRKKSPGTTGALARLPAGSFVVVTGNLEAVRQFPAARNLRDWITRERGSGSEGGRRWNEVVQQCGFDPWERLSGFAVAADRRVLQGQSQSDFVAYLDGRFTEAEATRCITAVVSQGRATLTTSQVNGRTVHALTASNGRATQIHPMANSVLVTERPYLDTALRLAHSEMPGLTADGDLGQMLRALGADNAITAAVDVAAVRAQNERTVNQTVDDLVRENPQFPDLALAKQARTGGLGVRLSGGDVSVTARLTFPQPAQAASFTRAAQGLYTRRRTDITDAVRQAQGGLNSLRLLSRLTNPEMNARFETVDAAFSTAQQLVEQVQFTQDGSSTVATLRITSAQVHTFEEAARAMRDIIEEGSRRRGGGLMRPRGNPFDQRVEGDGGAPLLREPMPAANTVDGAVP
ncbi:MAG: hypothetical protein R3A52_13525 [Polyangiales bacterium]